MSHTIVLMGASGGGKTTIGRMLADRYDVPHIDIDQLIERQTGAPIRQIFADHGEAHFRALERDATIGAIRSPGIVSLGGGAPMTPEVREALQPHHVIWLKVSVGEAVKRIGHDAGRPLLSGPGVRATLIRMLAERTPVYDACASLAVDTNDLTPDEVVAVIAEHVALASDGVTLT